LNCPTGQPESYYIYATPYARRTYYGRAHSVQLARLFSNSCPVTRIPMEIQNDTGICHGDNSILHVMRTDRLRWAIFIFRQSDAVIAWNGTDEINTDAVIREDLQITMIENGRPINALYNGRNYKPEHTQGFRVVFDLNYKLCVFVTKLSVYSICFVCCCVNGNMGASQRGSARKSKPRN